MSVAITSRPLALATRFTTWVRLHRVGALLLIAPVLSFLLLMLMLPLASMVELSLFKRGPAGTIVRELSLINYVTFLQEPVYLKVMINSCIIVVLLCIITVLLDYIYVA